LEITGGEPFLHKDLFEIVDYAHSKGIRTNITTNGLLIKENLNKISESKISHISVSIDGLEKTHDWLRNQQGAYRRTLEGIELLKEQCRNVPLSVNFVITNKNIYELERVVDFFKAKNINVSFFPVINKPELYLMSAVEKKIYIAFIEKLKRTGKISSWQYVYYINALKYFEGSKANIRCLGLVHEVAIDAEGNILPCCVWKNEFSSFGYLGNVFKEDLEQLWFSDKFHQARKSILEFGCGNCYDASVCNFSKITGMSFLLKSPFEPGKVSLFKASTLGSKKYRKPEHVHIRLTSRCNLSCRHCDIWKNNHKECKGKELSCDQWKGVIDKICNWLSPRRLDFAGGEILLHKDAIDIIRYSAEKGFISGLTTNALLINEEKAEQIVSSGLSTINVSLDGARPATHNYVRNNPESFLKAKNAIEYIKRYRRGGKLPRITISPVIMRQNLDELLELVVFAKSNKGIRVNFQAIDQNFGSVWDPSWYKKSEFWPRDSMKTAKIIDALIDMKKETAEITSSENKLRSIKSYFNNPEKYSKAIQCATADKNIIIDEFGNVLLCWNMAPIGNILQDSIDGIWNNRFAYERRQEIRNCARTCKILNCNFIG
jgi:radical SAM protein with 4Fe4S-binding SPASM domain